MMVVKLLALAVALSGCTDAPVEIRACNETGYPVMRLVTAEIGPQDLAEGECAEYATAKSDTYQYSYCVFLISGELYQDWPIDYLGATPLEPGRWTYVVKLSADLTTHTCSSYAVEDEH